MGHQEEHPRKDYRRKDSRRGGLAENAEDSDMAGILKRLQQQVGFLERKIDRLTEMLEGRSGKTAYSSKFSAEKRPSPYGEKERTSSRGREREDSRSPRTPRKEGEPVSVKPFGKSYGRPIGKPLVRHGGDKKKKYTFKKVDSST